MKLRIISFLFLTAILSNAQIPESPKLSCEYSSLTMANFGQGTLRDEAAMVLNNTVKMMSTMGMKEDQICRSGFYVRARKLYERVAAEQTQAAAVRVKYSSKESSL